MIGHPLAPSFVNFAVIKTESPDRFGYLKKFGIPVGLFGQVKMQVGSALPQTHGFSRATQATQHFEYPT